MIIVNDGVKWTRIRRPKQSVPHSAENFPPLSSKSHKYLSNYIRLPCSENSILLQSRKTNLRTNYHARRLCSRLDHRPKPSAPDRCVASCRVREDFYRKSLWLTPRQAATASHAQLSPQRRYACGLEAFSVSPITNASNQDRCRYR